MAARQQGLEATTARHPSSGPVPLQDEAVPRPSLYTDWVAAGHQHTQNSGEDRGQHTSPGSAGLVLQQDTWGHPALNMGETANLTLLPVGLVGAVLVSACTGGESVWPTR